MSGIKLVVTDIDGTLVPEHAHAPTPAVNDAMQAVKAAGVTVAAATARPYEMAHDLFVSLGLTGPNIFDGGATIYDVTTGEVLWSNWLSVERLHVIADLTFKHCKLIDFFPGYRPESTEGITAQDVVEDAPYAWCLIDENVLPKIVEEIERIGGLTLHVLGGWKTEPGYVDIQITDVNSDKFHGVTALQGVLGVTKEETLAIGDGSNDRPLFRAAGTKVAMGNAIPELKELADYVVGAVDDDGWAEAMNSLVLDRSSVTPG